MSPAEYDGLILNISVASDAGQCHSPVAFLWHSDVAESHSRTRSQPCQETRGGHLSEQDKDHVVLWGLWTWQELGVTWGMKDMGKVSWSFHNWEKYWAISLTVWVILVAILEATEIMYLNPEILSQHSNSCVTEMTPVGFHLWRNVFILVGKFLAVCAAIVLKNGRSYLQKTTLLSGLSEKLKGRKEAVRSFLFASAMRDFAGFIS